MKNLLLAYSVAVVMAVQSYAAVPLDELSKLNDEKLFQGSWVVGEKNAKNAIQIIISGKTFVFKEGKFGGVLLKGTFTLDPSKRPKHIELKVTHAPAIVDQYRRRWLASMKSKKKR